jgi:hypothetical protein
MAAAAIGAAAFDRLVHIFLMFSPSLVLPEALYFIFSSLSDIVRL